MSRNAEPLILLFAISLLAILSMSLFFYGFGSGFAAFMLSLALQGL